ncbi:(2Fe-2S)-binding protein [Advenella sp. RU8]|uniref:(2Fe-2S)-binding protein n=1 Tax=Advenella sp. RU8 TaxID=3399575 RepID=UPI003AACE432
MYICICNAITEKSVIEAVNNGASTLGDLQSQLGVASCCGCCAQTASEYLPQGSSSNAAVAQEFVSERHGRKALVSTVLWQS